MRSPGRPSELNSAFAAAAVLLGALALAPAAQAIDLLDGASHRFTAGTQTANDVAVAGDINGDGADDIVIGSSSQSPASRASAGSVFVVYGSTTLGDLDLTALGPSGFRIDGAAAGDRAGVSVAAAGDVNGDAVDDLILSAPGVGRNGRTGSGSAYVVYGQNVADPADLDLSLIDSSAGARGFVIDGPVAGGSSVVASPVAGGGDLNGDGRDDVAWGTALTDNLRTDSGSAWVVYGGTAADHANVDLLALGAGGFRVDGAVDAQAAGEVVSGAGDANADGRPDLAVGTDHPGSSDALYVVYGRSAADPADVDLNALGTSGFALLTPTGAEPSSVSPGGDANDDGSEDLIVGQAGADNNSRTNSGSAYVIYGRSQADPADLDLSAALGANGFRIDGAVAGDGMGTAVGSAGDVNSDGRDEVIAGARSADNNSRSSSGSAYVVLTNQVLDPPDRDLASNLVPVPIRIDGAAMDAQAGASVDGGADVNADGLDDVLVGANSAAAPGSGAFVPAITPPNDNLAGARALSTVAGAGQARGGTGFATEEGSERNHGGAGNPGGASIWFSWTAPSDGMLTLDLCSANFNTLLSVYTGALMNQLVPVPGAADDDSCDASINTQGSRTSFATTASTTYRIAVDGFNGGSAPARGSVVLNATFTDPSPPDTSILTGPTGPTNGTTPTFTFSSSEPGSTFECAITAGGPPGSPTFGLCSGSGTHTTDVLAPGTYTFHVRARDAANNVDAIPETRTFTVDTTAPVTGITAGQAEGSFTNDTTPTFTYESEAGATFDCSLDQGAASFGSCPGSGSGSFTPIAPLTAGVWTFRVRATDAAGNLGTATTRSFTVDTAPPDTTISAGPAPGVTIADNTPTFEYSSETGATFQCSLVAEGAAPAFESCPGTTTGAITPPTAIADGAWVFSVRARDGAGNFDGSPDERMFTVDTTPPETSITGGPAPGSTIDNPHPTFSYSSEAGGVFECSLDQGAASFAACPGTTAGSFTAASVLADGTWTFRVRAVDAVGNTDPEPATVTFSVSTAAGDTTPPETLIESGPTGTINVASASFAFSASEPGSTFKCSLDGAPFSDCTSPRAYDGLVEGSHSFEVRATDAAGNADATPASRSFTVDLPGGGTLPPDTRLTRKPPARITIRTAKARVRFSFRSTVPASSFQCKIDARPYAACSSPKSYRLKPGKHTFRARAKASGATDPTPVFHRFRIVRKRR